MMQVNWPDFPTSLVQVHHMGGHRPDQVALHSGPCLHCACSQRTALGGGIAFFLYRCRLIDRIEFLIKMFGSLLNMLSHIDWTASTWPLRLNRGFRLNLLFTNTSDSCKSCFKLLGWLVVSGHVEKCHHSTSWDNYRNNWGPQPLAWLACRQRSDWRRRPKACNCLLSEPRSQQTNIETGVYMMWSWVTFGLQLYQLMFSRETHSAYHSKCKESYYPC